MLPGELQAAHFRTYPPEARRVATGELSLLRQLPLSFLPLLLREVIAYDWKFPAERNDLDRQFRYLDSLSAARLQAAMAPFAGLRMAPELERVDWVNLPAQFSEKLTAHLWATHEIDAFHSAAAGYIRTLDSKSKPEPLPVPRLGVMIIGRGVEESGYRLFRKLRREGVYFPRVNPDGALAALMEAAATRARAHPAPFAHWYIDGGTAAAPADTGLTCLSYDAMEPVRNTLVARITKAMQPGGPGPEYARTMLAEMRPAELGMDESRDPVFTRFQVSLLTEGSGTQLYSTTFVQWSAREALRRAQPLTLLARFAPRRKERTMSELLHESSARPPLDPKGSLVDADMGAYYTWINLQRLSGAENSRFLAWFENHREAVAAGPGFARGTESNSPVSMPDLVARLSA